MLLTVIVPIYNKEKHLDECLHSLKSQSLKDVEFLLVDDGSTDNSKIICLKYLDDNRFKYFKKENGGQVDSYLMGFEKSKGKYIGFVDADDYVHQKMFTNMINKAVKYNSDIVICNRVDINEDGDQISKEKNLLEEGNYHSQNIDLVWNLTLPPFDGIHMHNSRWNKIFRREIFQKNIKYCADKVRTFEDRFIVPACIFSSKSIYILNQNLYYYRRGIETSCSKTRDDLYFIIKKLAKKQKEMLIENNVYKKYKNAYEIAQLNYLSLFIDRNIILHNSFKNKLRYSKQIINDTDYVNLVKKHKKNLVNKKGLVIKVSFLFKSPLLLTLLSYLKKR